jgi:hypothetical protein
MGKHTVYLQVQKEENTICWCQKSILEIQEYNFFAGYHSLIAQQAMEAQKTLAASRSSLMLLHIDLRS